MFNLYFYVKLCTHLGSPVLVQRSFFFKNTCIESKVVNSQIVALEKKGFKHFSYLLPRMSLGTPLLARGSSFYQFRIYNISLLTLNPFRGPQY